MPILPTNPYFVSCDEIWEGRSGTPFDVSGNREYIRRFRVVARFKSMEALAVCLCPGLPLPGSLYVIPGPEGMNLPSTAFDLRALAINYNARQENDDDWQNWTVDVKYATFMPPGGFPGTYGGSATSPGAQNSPELEPPDIEWDYEVVQIAPFRDLDGIAFKNAAEDLFDPAPQFPVAYPILSITRNELEFNAYKAALYAFAVNKEVFMGCEPETVQCLPPKAKAVFRGLDRYWRVSYRLKFSYLIDDPTDGDYKLGTNGQPTGMRKFQPQIINEGTRAREVSGGKPTLALTLDSGLPTKRLLDQEGLLKPLGEKPEFVKFRMYRRLSFTDLIVQGLS